ncbi:MAG TPA: hypothetical protein VFB60_10165 [Ktedonobacteraceae bacterium]|nr:hypothetical protein [Ktedonobacteraceae bacterium]
MHTFSKEALERPARTLQAAGVLRGKAEVICRATKGARADEVVVAVVQHDLSFGGVWTVAREDLVRQISLVEDKGGWSFTFSPDTSLAQIEERCLEFVRIVFRRWEAMQRWAIRQR